MEEFVAAGLVSVEEVDEVFDCGCFLFALFALWLADLEHVCEEAFEVPKGVAEVDCLVNFANHGRVGIDAVSYRCCEMVWVALAQHSYDFCSVSYCQDE